MSTPDKNKSFTIRVNEHLLKAFQEAADDDRTSAQLIRDFMREYVKKNCHSELRF
ncbi:hypothetical protein [Moraxella bovis]|uniref:Uncharacterized protein n=1 Tax=Moraxella bovis TaxID=476 RepID=A0A378PZ03_MORBO|nr:hypothetical protein [Moraxella bovis]STY93645.1 Uncharacterised protein [Moraxella bovis]